MVCHGKAAKGLVNDYKKPLADGSYPPPPLNGTGHAWHHPLSSLMGSIKNGGIAIGGSMPAFKAKLDNAEMLAAIAYFQNWWPDETYQAWVKRGGLSN
jgi:mono/diheme cytochrome c family protein